MSFTSPPAGTLYRNPSPPPLAKVNVKGTWNYTDSHQEYAYEVWKTPPGSQYAMIEITRTTIRPVNQVWQCADWPYQGESGAYSWLAITKFHDGDGGGWQEGGLDQITCYVQ